jgi:hypothetical protein
LPAVVGELDRGQPGGQGAEQAAGVDLGQLVGVADQHDLDLLLLGVVEQPGELAGADHAGLVDHQHRPGLAAASPSGGRRAGRAAGRGGGADAGGLLQFERGPGGQRDPGDPDPGGFPGVAGGVERVGLAGAGLADHHLHPGTGAGEPADHRHLLVGQVRRRTAPERGALVDGRGRSSCRSRARLMARCSVSSSPLVV